MLFRKLFKQPWQHRNPEMRLQAVRELPPNDAILVELALQDPDWRVRQAVVGRLIHLDRLRQVYLSDPEPAVREQAEKRLRQLLCDAGQCPDHIEEANAAARKAVLKQLIMEERARDLLEYLAQNAQEADLRRQLLTRIQGQGLLGNIALQDPSGDIRLAALERVSQESTLQRIAKEARKRDKRLARAARERLERMEQARQGEQRRQDIIVAMAELAAQGGVDVVAARKLDLAWQKWGLEVQPPASDEQRRAYSEAAQAFDQAAQQHQEQHQVQTRVNELIQRAQTLAEELSKETRLDANQESSLNSALLMLENAWEDAREHWFDAMAERLDRRQARSTLDERFRAALGSALHRITLLHEHRVEISYLEELLDAVRHLADTDNGITRDGLRKLAQRWRDASRSTGVVADLGPAFDSLDQRFQQAMDRAETDLGESHQRQAQLDGEIQSLFGQLAEAIDEGQLRQAFSLKDKLKQRLERLRKINRSAATGFDTPYKRSLAKLNELRQWRNFAADRVREELLAEATNLPGGGLSAAELEKAVPDLRKRWNELNRHGGRPDKDQEEVFDTALAQAFEPVQTAREQARDEREASALQRDTLIGEVEQLAAQWAEAVAGDAEMDWIALDKLVRRARQLWRDAGHVDGGLYRKLKARFDAALEPLVVPLEQEREANRQVRQGLIEEAESLLEEEDIDQAIEQAKGLQRRWQVTLSGPRKREQAMWKRFRTALDTVFERRDSQRDAEQALIHQVQSDIDAQFNTLITELKTLTGKAFGEEPSLTLGALAEGLKDLKKRLNAMQMPSVDMNDSAGEQARKRLEVRWARGLERVKAKVTEAEVELGRRVAIRQQAFLLERSELLEQKANLCDALEAKVEQGRVDEAGLSDLRRAWDSLTEQSDAEQSDTDLEEQIRGRFEAALSAATLLLEQGGDKGVYPAELLQSNLERRLDLALRMELMSGAESPEAYQQQRMSMKVAELSAALNGDDVDPANGVNKRNGEGWNDLLRQWCLCGPVPAAHHAELHGRFMNCIQALS